MVAMNADKRNEDLLREASALGDEDGVRTLINAGIDVNSQHSMNGWTPLHWAAKRGHPIIVRFLLAQDADPTIKSIYGETALSLTNNEEIHEILSVYSTDTAEVRPRSPLPITPNYLTNPTLAPKIETQGSNCPEVSHTHKGLEKDSKRKLDEAELVLKVRTADSEEQDFIEIEIQIQDLTYENVFNLCCKELDVAPKNVLKLRKLPNTIVRKDKDVLRFTNFQELELVLANAPNTAARSQTLKVHSQNSFQETYKYANNSDQSSPLVKNSNYCKNGEILY